MIYTRPQVKRILKEADSRGVGLDSGYGPEGNEALESAIHELCHWACLYGGANPVAVSESVTDRFSYLERHPGANLSEVAALGTEWLVLKDKHVKPPNLRKLVADQGWGGENFERQGPVKIEKLVRDSTKTKAARRRANIVGRLLDGWAL